MLSHAPLPLPEGGEVEPPRFDSSVGKHIDGCTVSAAEVEHVMAGRDRERSYERVRAFLGEGCVERQAGVREALAWLLRIRPSHETMQQAEQATQAARGDLGLSPPALQGLLLVAGFACCVAMSMPQVHIVAVDQLNTYDVLAADDVVFTKGAYDVFVGAAAAPAAKAAVKKAAPAKKTVAKKAPAKKPAAKKAPAKKAAAKKTAAKKTAAKKPAKKAAKKPAKKKAAKKK